jgi:glutathione S-transferase
MSKLEMIQLYPSPWSERVRWGFDFKGVTYERVEYVIGEGEAELKRRTGQAQVPVLFVDGHTIAGSTAILDWLEREHPEPPLLPATGQDRAAATVWEDLMVEAFGPHARLLILGKMQRSGNPALRPTVEFMANKYRLSPLAEQHAEQVVRRTLTALKTALDGREYLIGTRFSRADLSTAALLGGINPPADDLVFFPELLRPMFTWEDALDAQYGSVFEWRDGIYRQHRGTHVEP